MVRGMQTPHDEPRRSKKPLSVQALEAFVLEAARTAGAAAAGGLLTWLVTNIEGLPL